MPRGRHAHLRPSRPQSYPKLLEHGGALGTAALVSPFFFWGTSMVAMKGVMTGAWGGAADVSPLFVAAVRVIPAGALVVAWAASTGRRGPSDLAGWGAVAAFALVDATLFQGCLAEGLERTSAGLGSVIIDSQPITVALLAAVLFGERLAPRGVAGLAVAVLGLALLEHVSPAGLLSGGGAGVAGAAGAAGSLWDSGEWWMFLAAQSMAVGTVMVRWVSRVCDPVMATGWHLLLGGVPLLGLSVVREPETWARLAADVAGGAGDGGGPAAAPLLSGTSELALLYASVLGSAAAYAIFFYNASRGNLTKLSSLTFLTPVFAAAFGWAVLGETLSGDQLLGAVVTLAGVLLVTGAGGEDGEGDAGGQGDAGGEGDALDL